jgi:ankyrin repeat protein
MTIAEAARSGDVAQLRALLEAGGKPEERDNVSDWLPVEIAAYGNQVEAVRMLLDAGADMHGAKNGEDSLLALAIRSGSREVFRLLLERGYRLDAPETNLPYLLTAAASYGHVEVVQWLLAHGADVGMVDDRGLSALTTAAKNDRLAVVKELLRRGADPNHRDNDTETVLMWAADHAGNAAVLRALIRAGADVNARNDMESTALSWVMREGDPKMVQALLDGGAMIRPFDLSRGALKGFTEAVRLLLDHGADAGNPEDLAVARNRGHREIANLLRQAATDQKLRETGENYPPPRYPIGTKVHTLTGTYREGWVVLIEWNFKHGRYGYHIEVAAITQARKMVSNRYWDDDLQPFTSELVPESVPDLGGH